MMNDLFSALGDYAERLLQREFDPLNFVRQQLINQIREQHRRELMARSRGGLISLERKLEAERASWPHFLKAFEPQLDRIIAVARNKALASRPPTVPTLPPVASTPPPAAPTPPPTVPTPLAPGPLRQTSRAKGPKKAKSTSKKKAKSISKPTWDENQRELVWEGQVIRSYPKSPAKNQIDVLEAFQREGWPSAVDSPFEDIRKLGQTLYDLQKKLVPNTIRFRADGTGERIIWEPVEPINKAH
jgi:hypothetical protein